MAGQKDILRSQNGVTLTRVSLPGTTVVAYHLKSKRTPQTWNFEAEAAALAGFEDELDRVRRGDPA